MAKVNPYPAPIRRGASASEVSPGLLEELQSEVSTEAAPLLRFIARHARLIMTLLALFVVFVVGFGVLQWQTGKRDEEAQLELYRLSAQPRSAAAVAALERFAESAPGSVRPAALMELGHAALTAGDAEKAAAAYGRVATEDANGALGEIAAQAQARSLLKAGRAAEALGLLETLENTAAENLRPQVRILLAEAAQAAGKPDRAVQAYAALLAGARGEDADFFRFRIERLKAAQAAQ